MELRLTSTQAMASGLAERDERAMPKYARASFWRMLKLDAEGWLWNVVVTIFSSGRSKVRFVTSLERLLGLGFSFGRENHS